MCAYCDCVLLIRMTCAVKWIIMRERYPESTSLSRPDLARSRGKTVSGHLKLSPDAVDKNSEPFKIQPAGERSVATLHYTMNLINRLIRSRFIFFVFCCVLHLRRTLVKLEAEVSQKSLALIKLIIICHIVL